MAIVDMQAWSNSVDADDEVIFERQQNWSASNDAQYYKAYGVESAGAWAGEYSGEYLSLSKSLGLTTIYVAYYMEWRTATETRGFSYPLWLQEGAFSFTHVHFRIISGILSARNHNGSVIYGYGSRPIRHIGINHLAFKVTVSDTVGVIEVQLDGNEIMNLTGLDTKNGGTGVIDSVQIGGGSYQFGALVSNPIVWSGAGDAPTGFFGMHNIHTIRPDGETAVAFTPLGAGTNDVEVDDVGSDDDTTHNESATVTNKDELTCESVPTKTGTIYAVQAKAVVKDPDGTATESVKVGLNSGTESLSGAQALGLTYEVFEGPIETVDPNTASAWTETNVNAADVVYEHA